MSFIKSPLNYTGGKFKLLPQLVPLFPKNINTFYDSFTGGASIAVNATANNIIATDKIPQIIELFNYLKYNDDFINQIEDKIKYYSLDKYNELAYLNARNDYNDSPNPIQLFLLMSYSFNHQLRFNSKNQFNMPFGKNRSAFNPTLKSNLINFINKIKNTNIKFINEDFSQIKPNNQDFVYCDPPYSITTATYNTNWSNEDDSRLFTFLDSLNNKNIKFMLSNVTEHQNIINENLLNWAKNYKIINIQSSYSNCNYHRKSRVNSKEVVIINY